MIKEKRTAALFDIVKRGTRRFRRFINQAEFDLWLEILHQSRDELDKSVYFTFTGILEAIGRAKDDKNMKWLQKSLTRLKAIKVLIKSGNKKYAGPFIQHYYVNSSNEECYLTIDKQIGKLFKPAYAKILLDVRLSLCSDLSRWLHAFISSQKPRRLHTIEIEKLKTLSGSSSTVEEFRRMLKKDLTVLKKENILDYWHIQKEGKTLDYCRYVVDAPTICQ
jgi:hypothetical protein